jgi:uncharacterized protein DUF4115
MSDLTNDPRPPVPDLIEQYRLRRDAWIAQADELARLRDEVRSSAEREAMEIVTAARRDVRQVIMEARRELLVLSAQVQAALGEVSGRDPVSALNRAADPPAALLAGPPIDQQSSSLLVPEHAVKTMLDEARSDIEALAEDARTVPFQAASLETLATVSADQRPAQLKPAPAPVVFESIATLSPPSPPSPPPSSSAAAAARSMLSSPFPSDAVAVPPGRSVRLFVGLFVLAGVAVVGTSIWWVKGRSAASEVVEARPRPAEPASAAAAAPAPPVVPAKELERSRLSLTVEARRPSWIRTTVDGESDIGRVYAAGEKLLLNADQGISLRVGDAGAVFVSVNKGQPAALGLDGQIVTRQFVVNRALSPGSLAPSEPAPSAPVTTLPKPVPPSVPTASLGAGSAPSSLPGPIVQPTVAASRTAQLLADAPPPLSRPEPTPPPARVEPAPAPAAAAAPASAIAPQPPTTSAVVAAARQWLDAYQRQERSVMASLSTDSLQLADERRADERFPANADVSRSLDRVSVQIAADTAVLTAVMTERDAATQRVSPISQVWVHSGGQWRVRQVRLVSEARLNQIFR